MADITHMTRTNISNDKIKFYNLHKSFFSGIDNTTCEVSDKNVIINEICKENPDPASVQLEFNDRNYYFIYYWDGYSLAEKFEIKDYKTALIQFKKYAKRLAKNLKRYK